MLTLLNASTASQRATTSSNISPRFSNPIVPGIYVPIVIFFDPDTEDLDLNAVLSHTVRLAQSGVTGIAVQGSNGEAIHLTHDERNAITATTRKALDAAGFTSMPLIVGCGAQSTRETIALCKDAYRFGGDCALVLPPCYYRSLHLSSTVMEYFIEVANNSPIPLIIYNFPEVVGGLDLDSNTLITLGKHPNIIGCKFTCGNTGKLNRVASALKNKSPSPFLCFAGSGDFALPTLTAGGAGIIAGIGNVAPKLCVRLMQLYERGEVEEAQALQEVLARGDWVATKSGVLAIKVALREYWGYESWGRRPLPRLEAEERSQLLQGFEELIECEKAL